MSRYVVESVLSNYIYGEPQTMSKHRNLMTVCFAAVFALGLAACSSSSDDHDHDGGHD